MSERGERPSLHRQARTTFVASVVAGVVVALLGGLAFRSLLDARADLVDTADPSLLAVDRLLASLVDQETGVRGFVLSLDHTALEPYERGRAAESGLRAELGRLTAGLSDARPRLAAIDAAIERWHRQYVDGTIAGARAGEPEGASGTTLEDGRRLFDGIRRSIDGLQRELVEARSDADEALDATTLRLIVVLSAGVLVLIGIVGSLWRLVRQQVELPLEALGDDARIVASGEVGHLVAPVGPAEIYALGEAMEQMRLRILADLAVVIDAREELERQSVDLARSNAELEQFAYVASHDLQEPLRKVASFCQLLQSRYGGQLDERADQYIEFAVDGAKRMQALINDLLAFSRVGRIDAGEAAVVPAGDLASEAVGNLATAIEESSAVVETGLLPAVRIEPSLGVALFQNLIANAIKFRDPEAAPVVRVSSLTHDGVHEFAVVDNGIGIAPEHADRVFVLFQRLHTKEQYTGTGIGLAMCRKIVEHQGGRMWVDTDVPTGTTIRFTLPIPEGTQ